MLTLWTLAPPCSLDYLRKNIATVLLLIGLESTGHYAENLIYFLYERGYRIGVINPIQTDALRDSNIRKTKTDKIDTKLIVH